MRRRNLALFAFTTLIWSSNWVVMKFGLKFVSPLNLVTQRFLFASIALLPVLLWKRKNFPRDRGTWLKLVILSLINSVGITSTNIGLVYESSGLSSLLTYTQPLFVFCLAVLFLNERANITKALGTIMGFSGVAILYAGRFSPNINILSPIPFLILGAFLWAVTIVYYKKLLNHLDPAIVNIIQFPVGFIFLFAATLISEGLTLNENATSYIFAILYMSVFGSAVASTLWLLLIREEETIVISTSSLLIPAIALILGWIFLGESLKVSSLLGFIFISSGIYLVNRSSRNSISTKEHTIITA